MEHKGTQATLLIQFIVGRLQKHQPNNHYLQRLNTLRTIHIFQGKAIGTQSKYG